MFKKICVFGLGYIGLPTGSLFATNGIDVVGIDVNENIIKTINEGKIHIEEPGLKTIVQAAVNSKKLTASLEPEEADAFIIAVPTPFKKESRNGIKEADMSYVEAAAKAMLPYLRKGNLVILESTSPIGTCENLLKPIIESVGLIVGRDIYLAHCPERVLPGNILNESINNARIIGGINPKSAELAERLYRTFVSGEIFITTATTAEMCKLIENTYRDVNIALANEIAGICEKMNVNAWEAIEYANKHPRVNIHSPGPGVGGHCISVDPWFIIEKFPDQANLIRTARLINDNQPKHVINKLKQLNDKFNFKKITLLGITYKGNVGDVRESPALEIMHLIKESFPNIELSIYDPHVAMNEFAEMETLEPAFNGSDIAVVLANHNEFKYLFPEELGKIMRNRVIYDTRKCINLQEWQKSGFQTALLGAD